MPAKLTLEEKKQKLRQLAFDWMVSNLAEGSTECFDPEFGYVPKDWVDDSVIDDVIADFVMGELVLDLTEFMATRWPELFMNTSFRGHGDVDIVPVDEED